MGEISPITKNGWGPEADHERRAGLPAQQKSLGLRSPFCGTSWERSQQRQRQPFFRWLYIYIYIAKSYIKKLEVPKLNVLFVDFQTQNWSKIEEKSPCNTRFK